MKTLLIVILCLTLSRSFPTLGGYETLDTAEAQADANVQSLINAGLQTIINDGIQKGELSSDNFYLTKINSIQKQQGNENNYRFDCEFSNDDDYTIKANFDANYQDSNSEPTVTQYTYKVTKSSIIQDVEGLYTQVEFSEFENNQELENLVIYGVDETIKKCIANQYLPDLSYKVSDIHWVYRQVYENAIFYKCNVDIVDNNGKVQMNANFTVYYQPLLEDKTLVDYSCVVKSEEYGDKQAYVNTATIAPIENQYSALPETEVQNSKTVQDVLDYGLEQITQIAVNEGKIPQNTELQVVKVDKAENQIVGNGVYYRFTCEFGNNEAVTVTTNFTVYYDVYSQDKNLTDYSYTCEVIEEHNIEEGEVENEFVQPDTEFIDQEQEQEIDVEDEPADSSSIFNQVFPLPEEDQEEDTGNVEEDVFIPQEIEEEQQIQQPEENQEEEIFVPQEEEQNLEQPQQIEEEEQVSNVPEGYTVISNQDVENDSQTSSAFQYGVDTVIQKGKGDSKIPNYDYTVGQITEAYQKSDDQGSFYKFKCVANSDQGSTLWLSFTTYYEYSSQETKLLSYSYRVRTEQVGTSTTSVSTEGNYVKCTEDEINSSKVIQEALNYGVAQVSNNVEQEREIDTTDYSISEVTSVYKQETVNGISYKCEVVLENPSDSYIYANFTVYHDSYTKENSLSDYSYDVKAPEVESESNLEAETEQEYLGVADNEGWQDVNLDHLEYDEEYKDMLLYAINEVIQKGYDDEKIPKSEYKISNIDYVKKKPGEEGENYYKCGVELVDVKKINVKIKITFTASIKMATGWKKLWNYSYNINIKTTITQTTQVPNAGYTEVNTDEVEYNTEIQDCIKYGVEQIIPNPQDYALTDVNSVYRQVVGSAIYYKYNIELTGDHKSAQLSCTVYYKPDSDVKDVYAYSYKTQKSSSSSTSSSSSYSWWSSSSWSSSSSSSSSSSFSWNSSPDYSAISSYKYKKLDVSEVENDSKYQDILDYGVNECLQDLKDNKVVADNNYDVNEVLDAYVQENDGYENCKMNVKLTNSIGISLNLDFNVQYQYQSEEKIITSYSVEGSSSDQGQVLVADYNAQDGGQLEVGNCDQVPSDEVESTGYVQEAIDYGVDQVVDKVVENEGYEDRNFEVKDVKNVYREVVNPNNYKVDATLENSQGNVIDCSFSVNYQPSTDTKEVLSYSYITY